MRINRSSPVPLYYQLKQHLLAMIKSGELQLGGRVPSEEELIDRTGLSRFTVRQALQELEREGWITRIRGKGTFVTEARVPLSVAWQLLGFTEDMKRKGHKVQSRILENSLVPAPPEAAQALELKAEKPVVFIKRLRLLDEQPYLVDMIHVRSDLCPGLEDVDMTDKSLFATLEECYGLRIRHARRSLSIERAASWAAKILEVRPGTPLFLLKDLGYTEDEQPVQFARTLINEKKSEFVFDLYRTDDMQKADKVTVDQSTHPNMRRSMA